MLREFSMILCSTLILFAAGGCQTEKSNVVEGALIGGVLGGTAGGVVGHQSHHGGEGAAIGVAAGVFTGAIVGSQIPKSQQANQGAQAPGGPSPTQMSLQQIVDLSKQGANEDVIIDKIHLTNSRFNLTDTDIVYLKQQGVTQRVIDAMRGM